MNLPSWVAKVSSIWAAIGTLLIIFGAQGVAVPQILINIFSQATVDAILVFVGSVITFLQFVRTLAPKSDSIKSLHAGNKWAWVNPLKIS